MLEGSCLIPKVLTSSCQSDSNWACMSGYRVEVDTGTSKRPLDSGSKDDGNKRKCRRLFDLQEMTQRNPEKCEESNSRCQVDESSNTDSLIPAIGREKCEESNNQHQADEFSNTDSLIPAIGEDKCEEYNNQHQADESSDTDSLIPAIGREKREESNNQHWAYEFSNIDSIIPATGGDKCGESNNQHQADESSNTDSLIPAIGGDEGEESNNQHQADESSNTDSLIPGIGGDEGEESNNQRQADESSNTDSLIPAIGGDEGEESNNQHQADESSNTDSLIPAIGRDVSIHCLVWCSRSYYGYIAQLNRSFRSLIRSGELYQSRRKKEVIEYWIYFSCQLLDWEAYDPIQGRWMHLPRMIPNECVIFPDKESLAVGTELLVFTKDMMNNHVIYKYSILTNSWSSGMSMNAPRCLFGSASLGEIAILAGGCDSQDILNSAEMYNSETQEWVTLPSMHKCRKMCSGVFMDGKFYVIGGIGGTDPSQSGVLTCGEEYDLKTKTWTVIPNMSPGRTGAAGEAEAPPAAEAPPLVAVVRDELYAADYAGMVVKKYDKQGRMWFTVGGLPERAASMYGWGLAFRACGDSLIVIGGPRVAGEGFIELNSWVPSEGPPQWNLLARKRSSSFVYNCAVMGC